MAETTNASKAATILSLCSTTSDKLKDLVIKNGQLIFMHDSGTIAMDLHGKRTLYNQIHEIESEQERLELSSPVNGVYYFVIETAVLWRYGSNTWKQITTPPDDILFIGTEMPELGQKKTLYIQSEEGNEHISIWDESESDYKVVADKTQSISADYISALF